MTNLHCFTSASLGYLDRVRVLGQTLKRHHPNWTFWLCLVDQEPADLSLDIDAEPFDGLVRIEDLGIPNLQSWMFEHDIVELCTAVKGQMLSHLLDNSADAVIYLDPDIAVINELGEIENLLETHDVILTPHVVRPEETIGAILDNEIGSLKHGVYNLGFVAVSNRSTGRAFADWWRDRLLKFCFDDIPNGLFTDQRWCDLVPALFPNVHILRNPGYNVASWNISSRPVSILADGRILAGDVPLRFFHFTKVPGVGEIMLGHYAGNQLGVFELLAWYRSRLKANALPELPQGWWAFGRYSDGTLITHEHRAAYRARTDLNDLFPNPFVAGAERMDDAIQNTAKQRITTDAF